MVRIRFVFYTAPMQITYLSLNIWGGRLLHTLIPFLKEQQPDILAVQEVYNGSEPTLPDSLRSYSLIAQALEFPFHTFVPAFGHVLLEGTVDRGNAIFSKFPLMAQKTLFFTVPYNSSLVEAYPYDTTPYLMQHNLVALPHGKIMHVYNTHGLWGTDPHDNERRLKMSDMIVQEVSQKSPLILSGDFNVKESSQTIQRIARNLQNVCVGKAHTTINHRRKPPEFAPYVIDCMFVSSDIQILTSAILDVDVSDHLPLLCTLDI